MEDFLRETIARVEDQLGTLQAESAIYVKLRASLRELVKDGAEARQRQLTDKPNGKGQQLIPQPQERLTLRAYIEEVMEDRQRRSLGEIVGHCQRLGWTTTSSEPRQLVYEQVKRLVGDKKLRRFGRQRAYLYQSTT